MSQSVLLASFSANLSEWIEQKGISQSSLAKHSGVPQPTISKIVSGKWNNITLETVQKLSSALGIFPQLNFRKIGRSFSFLKPARVPRSIACFWDVDVSSFQFPDHSFFAAERIMNYGGKKEIQWLLRNVSGDVIKDVISNSRNLTPKSAQFWALVFAIPNKKIKCLKMH